MRLFLLNLFLFSSIGTAIAGVPAPMPLVGATGPIGIVIAIAAYVAYRLYRRS